MTSNVIKVQLHLQLRKCNFQTRIKKIEKRNVHMEMGIYIIGRNQFI